VGNILLVDDDPEIVTLLRFLLEKEGHAVATATNGRDALQVLGLEPADPSVRLPDLMVLDIMMPVMDGFALNNRLHDFPAAKGLPVIVLTAKGQKMRDLFQRSPNVAAYVQKPFDPKVLRDLIASIISGKK
jgi:CheY-like chemotaxis protein